jgi:uncharacterized membrane protein
MPGLLRWSYLSLIIWQAAWLGWLPAPNGPALGWWGLLVTAPLLLTLRGVWRTDPKGINWASYLLILFFLLGVSEAWSSPAQRPAALLQLLLVCSCLAAIGLINRRLTRAVRGR